MATPPEPQNPTGAGPDGGAIVGVALVTGAARGIGAATVRRLLSQGWGVVATDICGNIDGLGYPMGTLKELRAVVDGSGGRGVAVVADVRDRRALDGGVDGLQIGFNVTYLLDALTALRDEQVVLSMRDANSSALVQEAGNERSRHVVMPLRL